MSRIIWSRRCYQRWLTLSKLDGNKFYLLILGKLQECAVTSDSRLTNKDVRQRFTYTLLGKAVCDDAYQFMHVHRVGKKKFENLKKSFKTPGISAWMHGNKGSKPPNALYSFAVMHSDTQCLHHLASVVDSSDVSNEADVQRHWRSKNLSD